MSLHNCPHRRLLFALVTGILAVPAPLLHGQEISLGGFIPLVGIGLTDEFKNGDTDATFFLTDPEFQQVGTPLTGNVSPFHDIALLDTGAATHILTADASGVNGFDINGNDFDGTNFQPVGGATGTILMEINDPLAIFAAGMGDRSSTDGPLVMNTAAFRGQSSFATLSAPTEFTLPNILGLPMAAHHGIHIQNSDPQIFPFEGRTVRTPQVEWIDLGSGGDLGILRRTDLRLRPGAAFVAGPLFVQGFDIFGGGGFQFHENPQSPTVVENGGLFLEVDFTHGENALDDKELLFDTGADLTVLSELTAKRLGFDAVLDRPDFILEVEGSGGVAGQVPGIIIDELNIDTVGGSFTLQNVPVAVLDVTNPNDPGNTINGIIGMNLFNGRDLVIDANPSIGVGGAGPSLYISDPVTQSHDWNTTAATGTWGNAGNWTGSGAPDKLWIANAKSIAGSDQQAVVSSDSTVFKAVIAGQDGGMTVVVESGAALTTFGETRIDDGGELRLDDGTLDAQFINLNGGTLSGMGRVVVHAGPLTGVVRNLSGRIEPGAPVGTLEIAGDMSLVGGELAFDLLGVTSGTLHDHIAVDRFAFLAGTLEVELGDSFTPNVGDTFEILSAGEEVMGEFDLVLLPDGFFWDVDYLTNSVVLRVTGTGSLAGDIDSNGLVNADDLTMWQAGYGDAYGLGGDDFLAWQRGLPHAASAAFVPEPGALLLGVVAGLSFCTHRRKRN